MPYVTDTRPYRGTRYGVNHNVFPKYEYLIGDVRQPPMSEMATAAGYQEITWGFRSTPDAYATQPVMTGRDIRNAIYHGDNLDIDPRAPGGVSLQGDPPSLYDNGHEFRSVKAWRQFHTVGTVSAYGGHHVYTGAFGLQPYSGTVDLQNPFDTSAVEKSRLYALGNRAINQSAPTAPEANLATMIGELSMLPTLPLLQLCRSGNLLQLAGNSGKEYLNVQFGWRPMVKDIQTLARSVSHAREIITAYQRDAGRVVRRRRTLVDREKKSSAQDLYRWEFTMPLYGGARTTDFFIQPIIRGVSLFQSEESVWFSGAFSYFLQETDSLLGKMAAYEQLANKLLGARLDADAVWELTPWSWLIDWFVDLQSFIGRANRLASDSLVLRHGYVMREKRTTVTAMLPNVVSREGTMLATPQVSFHSVKKERWRSTPYGFGLDVNALTPQRWAILAALGLTKSPGSLRVS